MPHLRFRFEEAVIASMRDAAARIAAGSAFVPREAPFTVAVFGSLHPYDVDTIAAAARSAPATLRGRFVQWEISSRASQLRATIEIEGATELLDHLALQLPRGKPWGAYYVTIGSVAGIESALHDDFLAAVNAAFPLDADLIFTLGHLELSDDAPPQRERMDMTAASRHTAKAHHQNKAKKQPQPAASIKKRGPSQQNKQRGPRHASPHRKWERAAAAASSTGRSSLDDIIKTARTGAASTSGRAVAHAAYGAASRAAVVQEARKVWVD